MILQQHKLMCALMDQPSNGHINICGVLYSVIPLDVDVQRF